MNIYVLIALSSAVIPGICLREKFPVKEERIQTFGLRNVTKFLS
jgi:hypothetical protein